MTLPLDTSSWAKFCPRCGHGSFQNKDGRRHECTQCGLVYFHNLATGVGAIVRCRDKVALIVRGHDPGAGLLTVPGGFVDPGETLEKAVLREIVEETGWILAAPRYLFSYPNTYLYRDVVYKTVDAFFEFHVSEEFSIVPTDEVRGIEWWRLNEVQLYRIAFESIRSAVEHLRDV